MEWVQAPGVVASELALYWQDQDLADQLKDVPGYEPFTLSHEVQMWVDSMQEVREKDGKVYGLPKPPEAFEHVIRAPAPPPRPMTVDQALSRAKAATSTQEAADAALVLREAIRQQVRVTPPPPPVVPLPMPEIGAGRRGASPTTRPQAMPSVGAGKRQGGPTERTPQAMPDIGSGKKHDAKPDEEPLPMPKIG